MDHRQEQPTRQEINSTTNNHGAVTTSGGISNVGNIVYGDFTINQGVNNEDFRQVCLQRLGQVDPRYERDRILHAKSTLLSESCAWVFQDVAFRAWSEEPDSSNVLWIHGDPGKGKTMIMMAAIEELENRLKRGLEDGTLIYFFCQKSDERLNNAAAVLRGLLHMLIVQTPHPVIKQLKTRHESFFTSKNRQGADNVWALQRMLLDVLDGAIPGRVFIVIDALDECAQDLDMLIALLQDQSRRKRSEDRIRWMVTSRNEPDITAPLRMSEVPHTSLEVNADRVQAAVEAFINHQMSQLLRKPGSSEDLCQRLSSRLLEKAEGTFLWAAIVCDELVKCQPWDAERVLSELPAGLTSLYEAMLERLARPQNKENFALCEKMLCVVPFTFRPLKLEEVGYLADLPLPIRENIGFIDHLVGLCASFLIIRGGAIYTIHQSAVEFFTQGPGLQSFQRSLAQCHLDLFSTCCNRMAQSLHRDMAGDCNLGPTIRRALDAKYYQTNDGKNPDLPAAMAYCCMYSVPHAMEALQSDRDIVRNNAAGMVHAFFGEHLLHWLEALSLLDEYDVAISGLQTLSGCAEIKESSWQAFYSDSFRFALFWSTLVREYPMQLYHTALILSPTECNVRTRFHKQALFHFDTTGDLRKTWSALTQVIPYGGATSRLCLSPDLSKLIRVDIDKEGSMKVLDLLSGRTTLQFHASERGLAPFSPDKIKLDADTRKLHLLSFSKWDVRERILDLTSGTCVDETWQRWKRKQPNIPAERHVPSDPQGTPIRGGNDRDDEFVYWQSPNSERLLSQFEHPWPFHQARSTKTLMKDARQGQIRSVGIVGFTASADGAWVAGRLRSSSFLSVKGILLWNRDRMATAEVITDGTDWEDVAVGFSADSHTLVILFTNPPPSNSKLHIRRLTRDSVTSSASMCLGSDSRLEEDAGRPYRSIEVAISYSGDWLLVYRRSYGAKCTINLSKLEVRPLNIQAEFEQAEITPDGTTMVTYGDHQQNLCVWDLKLDETKTIQDRDVLDIGLDANGEPVVVQRHSGDSGIAFNDVVVAETLRTSPNFVHMLHKQFPEVIWGKSAQIKTFWLLDYTWIVMGSKGFIWLPDEYRGRHRTNKPAFLHTAERVKKTAFPYRTSNPVLVSRNHHVVICGASGEVISIRFEPGTVDRVCRETGIDPNKRPHPEK